MNRIKQTLVTTLTISLCLSEAAHARIIKSISPPTGAGLGDVLCPQVQTPVNTPVPNNDNSLTASPNQIQNFPGLSCTPITFQAVAPIDTQLFVAPSGGTTEYWLTETVVNHTNSSWSGYNFNIGFGSGDNFGSPELILLSVGQAIPTFDFNGSTSDPQPTSSKFGQVIQDGSFRIDWTGGNVAPGESVDFAFALDVSDDEGQNFSNAFTIRQSPVAAVPEPDSLLGLLAVAGILGSRLYIKHKR